MNMTYMRALSFALLVSGIGSFALAAQFGWSFLFIGLMLTTFGLVLYNYYSFKGMCQATAGDEFAMAILKLFGNFCVLGFYGFAVYDAEKDTGGKKENDGSMASATVAPVNI